MEALETQTQATQEKEKCCDKAEYEVYHEFFKRNLFIVADGKDLQHNSC